MRYQGEDRPYYIFGLPNFFPFVFEIKVGKMSRAGFNKSLTTKRQIEKAMRETIVS